MDIADFQENQKNIKKLKQSRDAFINSFHSKYSGRIYERLMELYCFEMTTWKESPVQYVGMYRDLYFDTIVDILEDRILVHKNTGRYDDHLCWIPFVEDEEEDKKILEETKNKIQAVYEEK